MQCIVLCSEMYKNWDELIYTLIIYALTIFLVAFEMNDFRCTDVKSSSFQTIVMQTIQMRNFGAQSQIKLISSLIDLQFVGENVGKQ